MVEAPRGAIWAAEVVFAATNFAGAVVDKISAFARAFRGTPSSLESCKTAEDVIAYANSIRDKHPTFANELIAAANRKE